MKWKRKVDISTANKLKYSELNQNNGEPTQISEDDGCF